MKTEIIIGGIIKSSANHRYCFKIESKDQETIQIYKNIIQMLIGKKHKVIVEHGYYDKDLEG